MKTRPTIVSQDEQPRVAVPRRRGSRVTRVGWRLFRDDLSNGRFAALALLGLLAALLVNLATSPAYIVQAVQVVGSKSLSSDQATRLAGVAGLNIFAVDTSAVAARLKGAPYVSDLQVETQLPNIVRVSIKERRPSVVWVAGDTPWLVEEDGTISGQATTLDGFVVVYDRDPLPAAPLPNLPPQGGRGDLGNPLPQGGRGDLGATAALTATSPLSSAVGSDYRLGGHIGALELDAADAAQSIFMLLPPSGLVIGSIEYSAGFGVSVITPDKQRIIIGTKEQIETKIAICRAMLAQLAAKKWTVMDLRSTSRPAVQMVEDQKKP
jgi:cell division septal protein FtsQ